MLSFNLQKRTVSSPFSHPPENQADGYSEDMKLRCHNLVWGQQLSAYVTALPADQVQSAMVEHITGVMTHFKGDCFAW
jgi:GH35 family endo-1,4-beta-xylanase